MADLASSERSQLEELPRRLFGYRIRNFTQYVERIWQEDERQERAFSDESQRLTLDITRFVERQKTLADMTSHIQMECERLKLQLEREKINGRFAEDGANQEIRRLEEMHHQRIAVLDATRSRVEREVKHTETLIWKLSENLTRVLQESQSMANQQFASTTTETIWKDWAGTVLGSTSGPFSQELLAQGALTRIRILPGVVQVTSRTGDDVGYLNSVIMTTVPPAIIAYGLTETHIIQAEDVQVLRLKNLMVRAQYRLTTLENVINLYHIFEGAQAADTGELSNANPRTVPGWNTALMVRPMTEPSSPQVLEGNVEETPQAMERVWDSRGNVVDQATEEGDNPQADLPWMDPHATTVTSEEVPNTEPISNLSPSVTEENMKTSVGDDNHHAFTPSPEMSPSDPDGDDEVLPSAGFSDREDEMAEPEIEEVAVETPSLLEDMPHTKVAVSPSATEMPTKTDDSPVLTPLPDPSWHDQRHDADREVNGLVLQLPGVTETHPPRLASLALHAVQGTFDQEPLPGIDTILDQVRIPTPSWTDTGHANHLRDANTRDPLLNSGAPDATPLVRESTPPPMPPPIPSEQSSDAGSLDVRAFLFGKRVGQDIYRDTDLVARSGDLITPELVQRVEQAGFLPDLIVHMVF